jgi:uncharacterized protein (DUF1800 family)
VLTRRDALAEMVRAARGARLPAPKHLHATAVKPGMVALAWRPVHGRKVHYDLFRNGHHVARARHPHFKDHKVRPSHTYHYVVEARAGRLAGHRSRRLTVHTPARVHTPPAPPKPAPPAPTPPPPPNWPDPALTQPMVDRLFWRAGFGPTAADRTQWTGQPASALIEHFMTTPYALAPTTTPPTNAGNPIDPLASDQELQMEWLDRMQRTTNPFVERMNFFWHRHFAVSRDAGIPSSFLIAYRDRLRRYSDFQANPTASFADLALEMTTQDAAISLYLTGNLNRKSAPNENYAREFMELFTLGPVDILGHPNYSQNDVHELARTFTGYTNVNFSTGQVSFSPGNFDTGTKSFLGWTGAFDATAGVRIVLSQPSHGMFLVNKLWNEFIAAPIPGDALVSLAYQYTSGGYQLAPMLRNLLRHPLMFDSLEEPTMIKPPVVYTAGLLRTLGAPLRDTVQTNALDAMTQQPYHPPNVAGWEGGLSWMTTTTSVARFQLVVSLQKLLPTPADVPGESAQQAFDRAYTACGSPWLSAQTSSILASYAQQAPSATANQRIERYLALCELILGGPDGQVM